MGCVLLGMDTDAPRREIRDVALLDLTGANAEGALVGITRIVNVATILVNESLLGKLSAIPMERVASTVPVPDGSRVRVMTGQVQMGGEALAASAETADDVLLTVGQLVITSPVSHVGFKQLIVIGQVLAPAGSENALGAGTHPSDRPFTYFPYTVGSNQRVLTGSVRLSGLDQRPVTGQRVGRRGTCSHQRHRCWTRG